MYWEKERIEPNQFHIRLRSSGRKTRNLFSGIIVHCLCCIQIYSDDELNDVDTELSDFIFNWSELCVWVVQMFLVFLLFPTVPIVVCPFLSTHTHTSKGRADAFWTNEFEVIHTTTNMQDLINFSHSDPTQQTREVVELPKAIRMENACLY